MSRNAVLLVSKNGGFLRRLPLFSKLSVIHHNRWLSFGHNIWHSLSYARPITSFSPVA